MNKRPNYVLKRRKNQKLTCAQLIERADPVGNCVNCGMSLYYVGEPEVPGLDKYIHGDIMQSMYCDPT